MRESGFEHLIYARRGKVATVTLNRPDCLNALNIELYRELGDAVAQASADQDVQVITITGAGRAFSTGGDIKQGDKINREDPNIFAQASSGMLKSILSSAKVVVAKVNGIAHAGGLLIVAACDLAIASSQATFRSPEALVGLWEPYGPELLSPQIGIKRAKYLLLTCETIDAVEAERIGLINRCVTHEELDRATHELVQRVLESGPMARRMFKRMVNNRLGDFDLSIVTDALSSEEGREGMAAFAEKRQPRWRE